MALFSHTFITLLLKQILFLFVRFLKKNNFKIKHGFKICASQAYKNKRTLSSPNALLSSFNQFFLVLCFCFDLFTSPISHIEARHVQFDVPHQPYHLLSILYLTLNILHTLLTSWKLQISIFFYIKLRKNATSTSLNYTYW